LYLRGEEVVAAMPPIADQLTLAERALTALVGDAELPPKIGVHPRPAGSFAHAMPAALRPVATRPDVDDDLLGMKWVTGFPANAGQGIAPINALVILNDPATGLPTAILDGAPITALRTAAVSGVALRHLGPPVKGRPIRAAIVGAGVQGHSHAGMLGHVLPGIQVTVHDRHADRAEDLAEAASRTPGVGGASTAPTAREAMAEADVVVTAVTFARPGDRQPLTPDWLAADATVVAVDYAAMVSAAVARDAALFVTDDRGQFLANRDAGQFDGYPDPTATLGEAILGEMARPSGGRVLATPLGIGLADLVFGAAIVDRAGRLGLGRWLQR
jgi:N-[(2S)-2-amino-2-carboxyethyl]-L-glutamate dehydrogenase